MQIIVNAINFDLTEALNQKIDVKLKHLSHYNNEIQTIEVFLKVVKSQKNVRLLAKSKKEQLFSEASDPADMYRAINQAANRLEKQLIKTKKQKAEHH